MLTQPDLPEVMRHICWVEQPGILEVLVEGEEVLPKVLRALQVLQYPCQLFTTRAGPNIVKDDDLVDGKDGGSPRNLTRQVGAQLPGLSIVQHGDGNRQAHRVLASLEPNGSNAIPYGVNLKLPTSH